MGPEAWKRAIGESAWFRLRGRVATPDTLAEPALSTERAEIILADVLTLAAEAGWAPPMQQPILDPAGTKVLWPRSEGGSVAVLTGAGLSQFYVAKGHGWVLLRVGQLCRAASGPMLARLQELLASYEEQCAIDGVSPIPRKTPIWVVGGEERRPPHSLFEEELAAASPLVPTVLQKGRVVGPKQ